MSDVPSNLIPTRITQLPTAPVASEDSLMMIVYNGNNYQIRVGDLLSVAGVPTTRQVIAGTSLTGGGQLSSNVTLSVATGGITSTQLSATGVTAGSYGDATNIPVFTVDSTGRVTAASTIAATISGYVPTTRQVIAGTGLTGGGPLNANVTLAADLSDSLPLAGLTTGSSGVATSISRSDHKHPQVDLSSANEVENILGLSNGGTARSLTPNAGAIIWSGADGLYVSPAGTAGQVLVSGGSSAPTWGSAIILSDQPANVVYAGPTSGAAAPTSFRALVNADLPVSGVTANTYGSASLVPVITVNSKGVVTGVTTSAISSGVTSVGGTGTVNGITLTGTVTSTGNLTLGGTLSGVSLTTQVSGTLPVANGGTGTTTPALVAGTNVTITGTWPNQTINASGGGGSGTVTTVSVVSANGFAGTVANPSSTPAITLTTSISGMLKGSASALVAATAGTDFSAGTSALATGILKSTTSTGALTIAVAADFPILNQSTTGNATTATTATNLASGSAGTIPYQTASGTTAMLAVGTTGQVLTSNGAAAPTWATASGGGGTATGASYTNPTAAGTAAAAFGSGASAGGANALALGKSASAAGTSSIAIGGNGTSFASATGVGAIAIGGGYGTNATAVGQGSIAIGDGNSTGTHWQAAIGYNSNGLGSVAYTGQGAMALGGSYASGTDSFAAAIGNNTSSYGATGANSIAMGAQSKATGAYSSFVAGYQSQATGAGSVAIGTLGIASAGGSISIGDHAYATGAHAYAMGYYVTASADSSYAFGVNTLAQQIGKWVFGNSNYSGYQQAGQIVLRAATTTTTAVALTSDGNAASTNNQLIVASSQAMAIQGTLIAKQSGSGNMAGWNITGIVSNNGGTMAVSGLALTAIGSDSIGLGASPTIAVDNTNKGVTITSGYKSATTIHWVATVNTSEVTV